MGNFIRVLKNKVYILAIVIVSAGYIFYGWFSLSKTGKSVIEIIGSCGMALIIGLSITTFLRKEGLKNARNSDLFKSSQEIYADVKEEITPYSDKLPMFCAYKTEQETNNLKREKIINVNLNYSRWLDGFYDNEIIYNKLEDYQKEALEEVKKIKIEPYKSSELLSDLPNQKYKNEKRFGIDTKEYERYKMVSSLLSKILIAIISGYYTLSPLKDNNIAQTLWNSIQIAIWLLFGSLDYNNAKDFILNEYRQTHIIQKTALLNEFKTIIQKDPTKLDKYDDYELLKKLKEKEKQEDGIQELLQS